MIQANLLLSRPFIKINACLIGYGMWLVISQHQIITDTINVPVCFYKIPENVTITAPETVRITIKAPKNMIYHYAYEQPAIHLDISSYHLGIHDIRLEKENLFLPDGINLINLTPSLIQVQLQKAEVLL